jgi:hypothetical protein
MLKKMALQKPMIILRATCMIQRYLKACLPAVKKKFMLIVRIKAKRIKEKGIRNRVLKRAYRNKPLTEAQKQLNRTRFGLLYLAYNYNMKRGVSIQQGQYVFYLNKEKEAEKLKNEQNLKQIEPYSST